MAYTTASATATATSLSITWSAPPANKQHGVIKHYKVSYLRSSTSSVSGGTSPKPNGDSGGQQFATAGTHVLQNLEEDSEYSVTIRACAQRDCSPPKTFTASTGTAGTSHFVVIQDAFDSCCCVWKQVLGKRRFRILHIGVSVHPAV